MGMSNDEERVILAELYELAEVGAVDWRDAFDGEYGSLDSGATA